MSNFYLFRSQKKSKPGFLKIISGFLVLSFFLQEISLAAPSFEAVKLDLFQKPKADLGIPSSVATVEDVWFFKEHLRQNTGGQKLNDKVIYLLQDAHTNTSGQLNVAKTLDLLFQKNKALKYVFLEAGQGDESLSFLRKYCSLQKRKEASESALRQAKLQGSEYFDLTSNRNLVLWGVEDLKLYAQSVEAYKDVVKQREKFQGYLAKIDVTVETLKPKIFNPALLSFDEKHRKFQREEISLTDYFEILTGQVKRSSISLDSYPHLRKLKHLKALEEKIDFKEATSEQMEAFKALPQDSQKELTSLAEEERQPSKLSSSEHRETQAFYSYLEEKLRSFVAHAPRGDGVRKFSNLFLYFNYLKKTKTLNPSKVLEEQKALENELFKTLAQTPDEISLLQASQNLELLKKLFNLTLTPEEWDVYEKRKPSFDINKMTGFLNKKIMDFKAYYERAIFLEDGYEDMIQKCEEFYNLTYERDRKFIQNTLRKMDQENQTQAVLITGGFHSPNLKYLLKQKDISFVNLTPQVLQETNQKRYEEILLGSMDTLRKSTAYTKINSMKMSVNTNMDPRIGRESLAQTLGAPLLGVNILRRHDEAFARGMWAEGQEHVKVGARMVDSTRPASFALRSKTGGARSPQAGGLVLSEGAKGDRVEGARMATANPPFKILNEPERSETIAANKKYLETKGWLGAVEGLDYAPLYFLEDPDMPRHMDLIERETERDLQIERILSEPIILGPEDTLEITKEEVSNHVKATLRSFVHFYQSVYYLASNDAEHAAQAYERALRESEKEYTSVVRLAEERMQKIRAPNEQELKNLALSPYLNTIRQMEQMMKESVQRTGLVGTLSEGNFSDDLFRLAHVAFIQQTQDLPKAELLLTLGLGLYDPLKPNEYLADDFAKSLAVIRLIRDPHYRGIDLLRPVIEAKHSSFNAWSQAQILTDTPLAQGLKSHFGRVKEETLKASLQVKEKGTAVVLGAGAFVIFPLVELLKEKLPNGTPKYEKIILVEIAPGISKRALDQLVSKGQITPEEAARTEILPVDATHLLKKVTSKIDGIFQKAVETSRSTGQPRQFPRAEIATLIGELADSKQIVNYELSLDERDIKAGATKFVVLGVAIQDFVSPIKTYIDIWSRLFGLTKEDEEALEQWDRLTNRIRQNVGSVVVQDMARVLLPKGIAFIAEPIGIQVSHNAESQEILFSGEEGIKSMVPGSAPMQVVDSVRWFRPVNYQSPNEPERKFIVEGLTIRKVGARLVDSTRHASFALRSKTGGDRSPQAWGLVLSEGAKGDRVEGARLAEQNKLLQNPFNERAGTNNKTKIIEPIYDRDKVLGARASETKRILLVEDNTDLRNAIARNLRDRGYIFETATNGKEALEKFIAAKETNQPFDLVWTDLEMPQMNGRILIREIRKLDKETPIILGSASFQRGRIVTDGKNKVTRIAKSEGPGAFYNTVAELLKTKSQSSQSEKGARFATNNTGALLIQGSLPGDISGFFISLTSVFPKLSGTSLALAEESSDKVQVYRLDENNPDVLTVTVGDQRYQVDTGSHAVQSINQTRRLDELKRDEALSESSSIVVQANLLRPTQTISTQATAVFVHLEGFGEGKLLEARLSSLSFNLKRLNPGSAVIFVGTPEATEIALTEARKLGRSQKLNFTDTLPGELVGKPQSHLFVQGRLEPTLKESYPSSARWFSIQRDGQEGFNVFAFGPQASFLQMIALADTEEKLMDAYRFFLGMAPGYDPSLGNPKSLSFEAFKEMIGGNLTLLNQFPALPKVTQLLSDAIQVYLISRVTDYSA